MPRRALRRDFIGLELSQAYVDMAKRRIMTEASIGNTLEAVKDATGDVQLALLPTDKNVIMKP